MQTLVIALLAAIAMPACAQYCGGADVLYYNGHVLTGKGLPGPSPEIVSAFSVTGGHIAEIGSLAEACNGMTRVDLHGAFVMPGFNDAHTHMASAGQQKLSVDLDGTASLAEMQQRIRAFAASAAPGQWILGGGWDHTKWSSKILPTKTDLDAVTEGHPALLYRTDGHIAVVNSAGLAAAGLTKATAAPTGSKIDVDAAGELTGIVREASAIALVEQHIPKPTTDVRRKALLLALADASAHGVTSVQDYSEWADFQVLEQLEREGKLTVRVSEWLTFNDPIATHKQEQASHPKDDPLLHTGMLKGFMDGSLGSRTAALLAPYSDDPKNSGLARYDQKALNAMAIERADAGFQLGFHAIGDRANTMALNAYEAVNDATVAKQKIASDACLKAHPEMGPVIDSCGRLPMPLRSWGSRFRIEHAQVVAPADFDRFAYMQVIASMQPSHLLTDMAWAGDRLGPERAKGSYAWRTFLNHKVVVAFGTDYPVESVSPFRGLYAAITRQNEAGTATYQPQEKLTIGEALYAYTQASAYAEFAEKHKGLLQPGYLADFVVLDHDVTTATPQDLLHTRVLRTVMDGKTVYTAPAAVAADGTAPSWQRPDAY